MAHTINSKRISLHLLLCLLCVDFVFAATIQTVQVLDTNESEDIYGENEVLIFNDFLPFTTRRRYIWEDYTVPTRDYSNYRTNSSNTDFLIYVFVPVFVIGLIITLVYICKKNLQNENCFSLDSDSYSSDRFTTVHRPPERRSDFSAQEHRPPSARILHNVTYVESPFASNSPSARQPVNTVDEKPPDYSTVTLSDLVNPARPAFPVVKKDDETPPPQYGKENPFLK